MPYLTASGSAATAIARVLAMLEHHEPGTLAEAYALDGVADLDDFDPLLDAWDIYRHDRGRGYN